jgi:hypothetical protein
MVCYDIVVPANNADVLRQELAKSISPSSRQTISTPLACVCDIEAFINPRYHILTKHTVDTKRYDQDTTEDQGLLGSQGRESPRGGPEMPGQWMSLHSRHW